MSTPFPPFIPPIEQPGSDTICANLKELFTVQERLALSDLISRGHIDHVGAALDVDNPERAYWLDQYLILKRPANPPVDSIVEEELRKYEAEVGAIDTPEKAAFWDARMQLERNGKPLPDLKEALKVFEPKEDVVNDIVEPVVKPVEPVVEPTDPEEVVSPDPVVPENIDAPVETVEAPEAPVVFGAKKRGRPAKKA